MRFTPFVLVACACLFSYGCGKKAVDIVGKWKLNTPMPMPGASATDETFAADHTFTGAYGGTWSLSGDLVTLKITTMGGMSVEQLKTMMASQPNGAAAAKFLDNMSLQVDSSGKNMSITDGKGTTSTMAMFTKQ